MEVHRENPVGTGAGDEVGDEFSRNRRTRTGLAILPGVAEIGDDRGNSPCRGAPQRVGHDQNFHQMIVRRIRGRLNDKSILAAHVLSNLDENLQIGEAANLALGQRNAEIGRDGLRQRAIGVAR